MIKYQVTNEFELVFIKSLPFTDLFYFHDQIGGIFSSIALKSAQLDSMCSKCVSPRTCSGRPLAKKQVIGPFILYKAILYIS
jgi:hypothetical protein